MASRRQVLRMYFLQPRGQIDDEIARLSLTFRGQRRLRDRMEERFCEGGKRAAGGSPPYSMCILGSAIAAYCGLLSTTLRILINSVASLNVIMYGERVHCQNDHNRSAECCKEATRDRDLFRLAVFSDSPIIG